MFYLIELLPSADRTKAEANEMRYYKFGYHDPFRAEAATWFETKTAADTYLRYFVDPITYPAAKSVSYEEYAPWLPDNETDLITGK